LDAVSTKLVNDVNGQLSIGCDECLTSKHTVQP